MQCVTKPQDMLLLDGSEVNIILYIKNIHVTRKMYWTFLEQISPNKSECDNKKIHRYNP